MEADLLNVTIFMKNQTVSEKINYRVCAEITNMTMVMDLIDKHILLYELVMNRILFLSMLHKGKVKDLEYYQQNYLHSNISTTTCG